VASAKEAIKGILRMEDEVLEDHKKSLITRMLWKITEANGKYSTRYYSEKALKCSKDERRHDHVWTRKKMVERLIDEPSLVEHEIEQAIGCTVTKDEHHALTKFDTSCDGWERYKRAGIVVWDLKENRPLYE
jgi:hypothetical protein